jgi:hypothetical protein
VNFTPTLNWEGTDWSPPDNWVSDIAVQFGDKPQELGQNIADGVLEGYRQQTENFDWINGVETASENIIKTINKKYVAESPAEAMYPTGESIADGIAKGYEIRTNSEGMIVKLTTIANSLIDKIRRTLRINGTDETTNVFIYIGASIIRGLMTGMDSMMSQLAAKAAEVAQIIIDATEDTLETGSPSKVFMNIGKETIQGLSAGISNSSILAQRAITRAINGIIIKSQSEKMISAPMSAAPVYGNTVNFGDVHINNDMDWAVFKSQVQRALIEG